MRLLTFAQFLTEGPKTAVPCRRCGGSGEFLYNFKDGTRCYGCNGRGVQYVDLAAERARRVSADARRERNRQYHDEVRAVTSSYAKELCRQHGWTFDSDTTLGLDQLNRACATLYHQSFWALRDARLKTLQIVKPR